MKAFLSLVVLFCLFNCNNSGKDTSKSNEAFVYDMYEPSEMSILMNEMYDYNMKMKQEIIDGQTPAEFPEQFLAIHTAELSSFKSRNDTFEAYSKLFIEKQQELFNPESQTDLKLRYNTTINLCISCHTTECTGPIPKIKKLLIP